MKKKNLSKICLSFISALFILAIIVTGCSKDGPTTQELNGNFTTTFQFVPLEFTPVGEVAKANTPISATGSFQGMGSTTATINQVVDFTVVPTSMIGNAKYFLSDGDEIWTEFTATSSFPDAAQNITYTGTHTIIGGSGKYAGASGQAQLSGDANLISATGSFTLSGVMEY